MIEISDPAEMRRRSQIYRWHQSRNAVLTARGGVVFVDHYDDLPNEVSAAVRLGICDLSLLPRNGIIGPESTIWLRDQGYGVPQHANTCLSQPNEDLLVRLSTQELLYLRLSALKNADLVDQPEWLKDMDGQAYPVPRADSHSLFAVSGSDAATMFSKLCGVDLRPGKFANNCVAQTSVAQVNSIVIRHDLHATVNFYLLSATSAAEYLWECLLDAIDELDGKPVGIAALRALAESH